MALLARGAGAAALLLLGAKAARVSRKRAARGGETKFIAGVPVLNYHAAYGGQEASFDQLDTQREEEWLVVVQPGTPAAQLQEMCKASRNACNLVSNSGAGAPFIELRGTEADLEVILSSAAQGAVKYVEPDLEVRATPEVKSGAEASTWGLSRIGADRRSRSGAGCSIFVLDTGVRVSHHEFGGRVVPALDMSSGTPKECGGGVECADDLQGHGTHCAGTAAGATYGVAPAATVRSMKVLDDFGRGTWSWSYYALNWLAASQDRPAVASMSLGGSGNQQAMKDSIDGATHTGVTVVVAAGNEANNACGYTPAYVPSAITVGATTNMDNRAYFSNYGECVNLWAPGNDVVSAGHEEDDQSTSLSGTSMACPHVSGAAALLLDADPSMKPSAVAEKLLHDAVKDTLSELERGDTNALLYVGAGGPPATTTAAPTPAPAPLTCDHVPNSRGPRDGDCICNPPYWCFSEGSYGRCPYGLTEEYGWTSERYFSPNCTTCECKERRR